MKKLITLIILTSTCCMAAINEQSAKFIWNEGNATMFTARQPDEFHKAADVYNKLIQQEVGNASLYYNIGVAYLMAEEYDNALIAFRKSEEYSGSTTELEACIANAYSKKTKSDVLTIPWYRVLLFPHFKFAFKYRLMVLCIAYCLIWLGLILKIFKVKSIATRLIVVAFVVFAIAATSVTTSLITLNKHFIVSDEYSKEN